MMIKTRCCKCIDNHTTIFIFGNDNDKPTEFCINHLEDAYKMYENNKIKYKDARWVKNVKELDERRNNKVE